MNEMAHAKAIAHTAVGWRSIEGFAPPLPLAAGSCVGSLFLLVMRFHFIARVPRVGVRHAPPTMRAYSE